MGSSGISWLFILIYKIFFVIYLLILLLSYAIFVCVVLADNELFSFKEVIETGADTFLFFFWFSISNAIVYPLCYIFRKHLFLEEE